MVCSACEDSQTCFDLLNLKCLHTCINIHLISPPEEFKISIWLIIKLKSPSEKRWKSLRPSIFHFHTFLFSGPHLKKYLRYQTETNRYMSLRRKADHKNRNSILHSIRGFRYVLCIVRYLKSIRFK